MGILEELKWRGLLHQTTGGDALADHLKTRGRVAYCGFDPTRPSLTIGNLLPIMLLRRWQLAEHRPIALFGGATGLIACDVRKTAPAPPLGRNRRGYSLGDRAWARLPQQVAQREAEICWKQHRHG